MASEDPPTPARNGDTSSFFQPYEIRSATDADFEHFVRLADEQGDGWVKKLDKNNITIWQKEAGVSPIKMAKVTGEFPGVSANSAFDAIMDGEYRRFWDESMIEDYEHCRLDDCNDLGYYSMKCPLPLKNRDFVNQRSWRAYGDHQFIIFNHSVFLKSIPLKRKFIRGVSYITGFLIRTSENGCTMNYLTQTDPKGRIPSWIINFAINKLAPSVFKKMYMACCKYEEWKSTHLPDFKPWRNPEQNSLKVIDAASLQLEHGGREEDLPDRNGEEEEELPEDEDAMKEIADNIAKKLDAEVQSAEAASNGVVKTSH